MLIEMCITIKIDKKNCCVKSYIGRLGKIYTSFYNDINDNTSLYSNNKNRKGDSKLGAPTIRGSRQQPGLLML